MRSRRARPAEARDLEGVILESRKRQAKLVFELNEHKALAHVA